MAVTQAGTPGAVQTASGNAGAPAGIWSGTQPRTAGDLLVACVTTWGTTTGAISTFTAGWTQQAVKTSSTSRLAVAIYTLVAAGGDAAPTVVANNTGTSGSARTTIELFEFTGQDGTAPVVTTGTGDAVTSPVTITSTGNVPQAGCFGVSCAAAALAAAGTGTYTPGSSPAWTNTENEGATSQRPHSAVDTISGPAAGGTLSNAPTWSGGTINEFTGVLIVVQPPVTAPAPAAPAPDVAPGWFPGAPAVPGTAPFTPWPLGETGVNTFALTAAQAVTATAAASLDSAPAPWNLPPQAAPAWFPGAPAVPGTAPFTPWPLGETGVNSAALTAASAVTAAGAAALTEAKPLNAAGTVTLRAGSSGQQSGSTSLTVTLPAGWQAGDFCVIQLMQTSGNAVITIPAGWAAVSSGAGGGMAHACARRVLQAGDSSPVFTSTVSSNWSYSAAAFSSTAGRALAFDSAASFTSGTGVTSVALNPDTVASAGGDHASIITLAAIATASQVTTSHAWTPPAGWAAAGGADGWNDGTASVKARGTFLAWQDPVSGTVSPAAETLTDSASDTFTLAGNHLVIYETVTGPAVTAAAAAALDVIKAGVTPAPAYPPAWFPQAPSAPGTVPFTPWPAWEGPGGAAPPVDTLAGAPVITATGAAALTEAKPLNAAATVTAAGAAALAEAKPLTAAMTVTGTGAAAETTAKPVTAAQAVTATVTASLAGAPAGWELPPQYPPRWFPSAPGTPAGTPFAPWPAWAGAGVSATPVDALNAAQAVTATGAASLTEAKPLNAAATVTASRAAALTEAKPVTAARTVTATATASLTTAKPLTAAAAVTTARAGTLTEAKPLTAATVITAAGATAVTDPGLGYCFTTAPEYTPGWWPGAPFVPAADVFAPWPAWTGTLPVTAFTVGTLTAADAPLAVLTAATTPGAASGGILTATDQRTGGPG